MESLSGTELEDISSLVGRRFLDQADAAGPRSPSLHLSEVSDRVPGVRLVLAADPGGELLDASGDVAGVDADELAALAATLVILSRGSAPVCARGGLSHVIVELEAGTLAVQPLDDGHGVLLALVDGWCDLADLVAELGFAARRIGRPGARSLATAAGDRPERAERAARAGRRFVRPFVLTGGRTGSPVAADALVWCVLDPIGGISSEQIAVLHACQKPRSIDEIAEASGLLPGVVRVVVGDLMAAGLVAASMFEIVSSPAELYPRIIEALEALR